MKKTLSGIVACALALVLAGCAASQKAKTDAGSRETAPRVAAPQAAEPPSGTVAENLVSVRATVQAINVKKRLVTLREPDGRSVEVEVGEEVQNLPQVKKGDHVVVTYYEAVAYAVKKPGEASPGVTVSESMVRAKPGEKPGGTGAREVTITATIEAIDKKKPSVTLKGPRGKVVTVIPRDPTKLERVAVGDLVDITYTEALAIKVEKAPKQP